MSQGPRVVVTGMGVLAPNGNSLQTFWEHTLACQSGIAPITAFDTSNFPIRNAGEVKHFTLAAYCPNNTFKPKRLARHTQFALAATRMALRHAGIDPADLQACEPIPVLMGVSISAMEVIERNEDILVARGPKRVSPFGVSACQPHAVVSAIAADLGVQTQRATISSACPAGLDSIIQAAELIRNGKARLAIAGGADAPITPLSMASFSLAGLANHITQFPPAKASRPFDLHRQGGLISEGAGVLILESLDHARERGAQPWGEITGYGNYADGVDAASCAGLEPAMQMALANANLRPADIGYINAHGPSHPEIDQRETAMIKKVFGRTAYRIPISSIKGVIGNPLAAAGPLQLAATLMGLRENKVPPTANYETPDPRCDLDYTPNQPYCMVIRRALLNVHGLGGGNSSLIVERVEAA